jgi:uncharacterized repeat protein (TIGR01451 family)
MSFRPRLTSVLISSVLLAGALPAATPSAAPPEQGAPIASGSGPLVTSTVVELLETGEEGHERRRFVPAEQIRAGDDVYYTIRVRNPGRAAVGRIVVSKRLPFGMHYTRNSAVGPAAEVLFSVDGGESFAAPTELRVVTGGSARRANVEDYTHVRWLLRAPLAPGATALLRFRATLG